MSFLLLSDWFFAASETTASDRYARMMTALLPPGKAWRLVGQSLLAALISGCSDELGRLEGRAYALRDEADPSTAVELLPEHESELGLAATGAQAERQARCVARTVARQRYRPADFQAALAPLLGQAVADVDVIERTVAEAAAMADVREIYRFFVYRDPTVVGDYYVDSAQALVDQIQPSHTIGTVIESIDFLCDDPYSLCDRDLLGA